MKKSYVLVFMGLILVGLTGCKWEMPKKISVSTGASYSFSLGTLSYDAGSLYSKLEDTLASTAENSGITLIDYKPKVLDTAHGIVAGTQQFAIQVPIQKFDLDFSEYLDNVDLTGNLGSMNVGPVEIPVPAFDNLKQEQTFSVSEVGSLINQMVMITAKPKNVDTTININFTDENNKFKTIEFESGTMEFVVSKVPTTLAELIQAAQTGDYSSFVASDVTTTISIDGHVVYLNQGIGTFDLKDVVIDTDVGMVLNASNVYNLNNTAYTIVAHVSDDSKLKRVTGLKLSENLPIDFDTITIPAAGQEVLKECTIKTGTLTLAFIPPASWTNFNPEYSMEIAGGLSKNGNPLEVSDHYPSLNLQDVTYKNEAITVEPTVNIKFNDTTIDFSEDPKISFEIAISAVDTITVDLGENAVQSIQDSYALDDSLLNLVKRIAWNQVGITVKTTNTLPAGNDFKVTLGSNFLGITESTKTIASGDNTYDWTSPAGYVTKLGKGAGEYSAIDYKASIALPGYSNETKTVTLKNITLGETYSIAIEIEPSIDWKSVTIDNELAGISDSQCMKVGVSEMIQGLNIPQIEKLNFVTLPVHLYCDMGNLAELFSDPTIKGKISAYSADLDEETGVYTICDGKEEKYILGNASETAVLPLEVAPNLDIDPEKGYYDGEITGGLTVDLAEIMNDLLQAGNALALNYDVKFSTGDSGSEITLEKDKIENAGQATLDLSAIIILPLVLKAQEDIVIPDVLPMFGMDYTQTTEDGSPFDLLGRKSKEDMEDVKNMLKCVESAAVTCDLKKIPVNFSDGNLKITVKLHDDIDPIEITTKKTKIAVNPYDLLEIYPIQPKIELSLPAGNVCVLDELEVAAAIKLNVRANESVPLWEMNMDDINKQ